MTGAVSPDAVPVAATCGATVSAMTTTTLTANQRYALLHLSRCEVASRRNLHAVLPQTRSMTLTVLEDKVLAPLVAAGLIEPVPVSRAAAPVNRYRITAAGRERATEVEFPVERR